MKKKIYISKYDYVKSSNYISVILDRYFFHITVCTKMILNDTKLFSVKLNAWFCQLSTSNVSTVMLKISYTKIIDLLI